MDITSLEIGDQLTEDRKNTTYCTVQMENDQYTAVQEYRLDMVLYDDGEWTLQDHSVISYQLYPKTGVDETMAEELMASEIKADVEVFDGGFPGDEYWYDSTYTLTLNSHETDTANLKDHLEYEYQKDSEICLQGGPLTAEFLFDQTTGQWTLETVDASAVQVQEYRPEGVWLFDIYTYYINMNIRDLDYTANTAVVDIAASVWQSEAFQNQYSQSQTVGFAVTEEGMVFDPVDLPDQDYGVSLMLTRDNMYYKRTDSQAYTPVNYNRFLRTLGW